MLAYYEVNRLLIPVNRKRRKAAKLKGRLPVEIESVFICSETRIYILFSAVRTKQIGRVYNLKNSIQTCQETIFFRKKEGNKQFDVTTMYASFFFLFLFSYLLDLFRKKCFNFIPKLDFVSKDITWWKIYLGSSLC